MLGKGHVGLYNASTKEDRESEKLRGERDLIKFIDLGFERWKVVRLRKARGCESTASDTVGGLAIW